MVDLFALVLTHGLLALAVWRLLHRADLDRDPGDEEERPRHAKPGIGRDAP